LTFQVDYVEKYQMLKSKKSIEKRLMNSLNFHSILPMKDVNTSLIGEYRRNERFQSTTEHSTVVVETTREVHLLANFSLAGHLDVSLPWVLDLSLL
jgi:hypothetical protein